MRLGATVIIAAVAFVLTLDTMPASGKGLRYEPVNPSFGGHPLNSGHLLGLADRQNRHDGRAATGLSRDPAELFVRQLQSRLLSGLAREVTEAVFGDEAHEAGTIEFGDQLITFERGIEAIHLTIEDRAAGTTTNISVPVFQVE